MSSLRPIFLLPLLAGILVACQKQEAAKPPEKIVAVTIAAAAQDTITITESAVGAETAIVSGLGYDPTRLKTSTYIRLPFPEHIAAQLKVGQPVTLASFAKPDATATGHIREIRPALDRSTSSREVIVSTPRGWQPQGSVRGEVALGVRKNAVVVPEQAVVLRPAGSVVYVTNSDTVSERKIEKGVVRDGKVEVVSGLKPGERVVVDGAGMLSNGAKIKARETKP